MKNFFAKFFKPQLNPRRSVRRMNAVQLLIDKQILVPDSKNYHVAMLPELWHSYKTDKQLKNMLQNIKNYCDIENAANQLPVKPDQYLLVSFFGDNKKGVPYAYYRKMKISIIAENLKLQTQTDETNIFVSSM